MFLLLRSKQYSENKRRVLELVPPGGCWRDLPIDVQKSIWVRVFILEAAGLVWRVECLGRAQSYAYCSPSQADRTMSP